MVQRSDGHHRGGDERRPGVSSLVTALIGWRLLPRALALASPAQLQAVNAQLQEEIEGHRRTESRLHVAKERAEQATVTA